MSGREQVDVPGQVDREDVYQTARWLKRAGHAAGGVVYLVIGILSVRLAFSALGTGGGAGADAGPQGAIAAIARQPFGTALLLVLAVGLFAYAMYQVALGTRLAPEDMSFVRRAGLVLSAGFYLALAVLAGSTALGSGSSGDSQGTQKATGALLGLPGGRFLVGAIGAGVVAAAGYMGYRAFRDRFLDRLERGDMPGWLVTLADKVGTAGLLGRAFGILLVGWFILFAAITYQPDQAKGLDGALRELSGQPYGPWVIAAVGVGFLAYSLLAFIEARFEQVAGDD